MNDISIIIDEKEKSLAFYDYPNTFWVDLIRKSIENSNKIETNSFYLFLQNLYEWFSKGFVFIVDEEWEGHDINQICKEHNYSYTLFDILDKFKENYQINHDFFKIISSNLYYKFYKKSNYIYPYLHWLKVDNFIGDNKSWWEKYNTKNIEYKFLYLNRVPKPARVYLYDKILTTNVLDNSIWSWNSCNFTEYEGRKENHINKSLEGEFIDFSDEQTLLKEPDNPSLKVFCSILIESETEIENLFISEKTAKCIIHEIPFLCLAPPYYLDVLKKLGFKTFDKWWDESYDLQMNLEKRTDKLFEVISYINNKTINELNDIYKEIQSVLDHNKKLYYDIHHGKKLIELTAKPKISDKMHNILRIGGDLKEKFNYIKINYNE